MRSVKEVMPEHRKSYWKTTSMALGSTFLVGTVAALWLFRHAIVIPGYTWTSREYPGLFWPLIGILGLLTVFGLAVAAGGLLCLLGESKR